MAITSTANDKGVVTINIGDRFTFDVHVDFRSAYREQPKEADYIINLAQTTYMDSSALGMLLLLREHAGMKNTIKIVNCDKDVLKIFEIARFDRMFQFNHQN